MQPISNLAPILYVEDDDDDVLFMRFGLQKTSVNNPLLVVNNGSEALDYFTGAGKFADRVKYPMPPALVLLDLNMPVLHGFEVLKWIRRHRQYDQVPVVVFSGSYFQRDRDEAMLLGASSYIVKPALGELSGVLRDLQQKWLIASTARLGSDAGDKSQPDRR